MSSHPQVVGAVAAAACRRWGWLLIMAGMTIVSLSMRRNIAPGAMVLVPLSLASLAAAWPLLRKRVERGRLARAIGACTLAAGVAAIALGGWWTFSVVTQRFYASERKSLRFGWGISRTIVPMDAAEWINANRPAGRVFCG